VSPLEIVASVITVINVWLVTRENLWAWPTGIVSAILYGVVYFQSRLFASAGLMIIFLVLNIYGWYEWLYGGERHTELHVTRTPRRWWPALMAIAIALTGGIGWMLTRAGGTLPYADASIAGFSIVAQWMMARKLLENWMIWICVNVVAVIVYGSTALYATSVLYAILFGLAWKGLFDWRKSLRVASA
jgi:nicotinamide mononucleotide transporter